MDYTKSEISKDTKKVNINELPKVVRWVLIIIPIVFLTSLISHQLDKPSQPPPPTLTISSTQIDSLQIQINSILKRLEIQIGVNSSNNRKHKSLEEVDLLLDIKTSETDRRIDLIVGGEK